MFCTLCRSTDKEDNKMAQYSIETSQLTKTYRGTPAVDHLDLRIPELSLIHI